MSRESDNPRSPRPGGDSYPSGTPPYGVPSDPSGQRAGNQPSAAQPPRDPDAPKTETTLTTSFTINIPGSRPIPPVVVREPVAGQDGAKGGPSGGAPAAGGADATASAAPARPGGRRHRSEAPSSPVLGVMDSGNTPTVPPDLPPEWMTPETTAYAQAEPTAAAPSGPAAPEAPEAPAAPGEQRASWFAPRATPTTPPAPSTPDGPYVGPQETGAYPQQPYPAGGDTAYSPAPPYLTPGQQPTDGQPFPQQAPQPPAAEQSAPGQQPPAAPHRERPTRLGGFTSPAELFGTPDSGTTGSSPYLPADAPEPDGRPSGSGSYPAPAPGSVPPASPFPPAADPMAGMPAADDTLAFPRLADPNRLQPRPTPGTGSGTGTPSAGTPVPGAEHPSGINPFVPQQPAGQQQSAQQRPGGTPAAGTPLSGAAAAAAETTAAMPLFPGATQAQSTQAQPTQRQNPSGPDPAARKTAGFTGGLALSGTGTGGGGPTAAPADPNPMERTTRLRAVTLDGPAPAPVSPGGPGAPGQARPGGQRPGGGKGGGKGGKGPGGQKPTPKGGAKGGNANGKPKGGAADPEAAEFAAAAAARQQATAHAPSAPDGYAGGTGGASQSTDPAAAAASGQAAAPAAAPAPAAARSAAPAKRGGGKARKLAGYGVGLVVLAAGVAYGAGLMLNQSDVPRNTTVLGYAIGGDTRDQAVHTLDGSIGKLGAKPLHLTLNGRSIQLNPSVAGLTIDTDATVAKVAHHSYNPVTVVKSLLGNTTEVAPVVTVDDDKLRSALQQLATSSSAHEGSVRFTAAGQAVAVLPRNGKGLDLDAAVSAVEHAYRDRASGLPDGTVALPTTTTKPKTTDAETRKAAETLGTWAENPAHFQVSAPGAAPVAFGPNTFSKALTLQPNAQGVFVPVLDLTKLQDAYGTGFAGATVNGAAVTPQDVAAALVKLLSKPNGPTAITLG